MVSKIAGRTAALTMAAALATTSLAACSSAGGSDSTGATKIAMRNEGIVGVVAESFSPGFWRGEVSNGMPLLTVPGISTAVERWDEMEVDWRAATVRVPAKGLELVGQPLNQRTQDMIAAGGRYALLLAEHGRG